MRLLHRIKEKNQTYAACSSKDRPNKISIRKEEQRNFIKNT